MPKQETTPSSPKRNENSAKNPQSETNLQMVLQKVIGQNAYTPTPEQVSKIIEQRGKIVGYVRKDREEEHEKFKIDARNNLHYFYGSLIFVVVIAGSVLYMRPEYFNEVLSALLGFAGGLGIGQFRKNSPY